MVTLSRALRRNSGRLLLTAAGLATIVGPLSADWNTSHIFNERWPSHARFHGVVGLCTPVALTLYGLWHLWTSSGQRPLATATATAIPLAYWDHSSPRCWSKEPAWTTRHTRLGASPECPPTSSGPRLRRRWLWPDACSTAAGGVRNRHEPAAGDDSYNTREATSASWILRW